MGKVNKEGSTTQKKYNIIYADPPWTYEDKAHPGKRGAQYKYGLMGTQSLIDLRPMIDKIAAEDCLLAMWWTPPLIIDALRVIDGWGFKLKTAKGFTWRKMTVNGKEHFGMGRWTRNNTEDCLFATRGRPKRVALNVRQLVSAKTREHSRKPDEVRDALVTLMGDIPRIELFARQQHLGWDVWGNQVDGVEL